jgi:hypothetical protein
MYEAQSVKMARVQNMKLLEDFKKEDLAEKHQLKNQVKSQQREAEEKRKRFLEAKREKARQENEKRIELENKLRREREEEVARMEQEELELIQRLQNTQLLQKSAYEDLENALGGQIGLPQ